MKYVLGFGILCKKYKNFPTIRLFVNDYLIDDFNIDDETKLLKKENDYTKWLDISKGGAKEFVKLAEEIARIKYPPATMPTEFKNKMAKLPPIIQSNINKKDTKKLQELRKYNLVDELIKNKVVKDSKIKNWWEIKKIKPTDYPYYYRGTTTSEIPNKIKMYEIDDHLFYNKEENNIKLEICNSDSNYSNGFMTNSTLIQLRSMFLIPKHLLLNNCKKLKQIYKSYFDHTDIRKEAEEKIKNFNDFQMGHWPMPATFKFNNKNHNFWHSWQWLGGNGTIKFNIHKIHNIYTFPIIDERVPFFDISKDFLVLSSSIDFNKYLYEDH